MSEPQTQYAYFQGRIVPISEATVPITTQSLHYGTGVFGGMRAYWNAEHEEAYIFRPYEHFERLLQSAALLRMKLDYTPASLLDILTALIQKEGFRTNCYIRPLAYIAEQTLAVRLHDLQPDLAIFVNPLGDAHFVSVDEGAHVCISAWRRVDDNAIPARGKVVGAYVNSMMIKSDAVLAGYDDALVLNNDGHVAEFSTANMMMVRKGVVITPPITDNILEGVVRRSLIHLLRHELGVEVVERPIDRTEVYLAEEMFMCGTGAQISPVTRIEHRDVGDGEIGPITRRLRDLYMDVVHGRSDKYQHWVAPVYSAETMMK
ncbi:MAG: branched chain amino acid aminotransferase [Anaerolineaceae bacterium]|nr:branched chain amino acid aminotransferase [Anaerolineaceae bacterium]